MDVRLEDETVWLSQKQMSELFGKDVRTVNEHIKNVFKEGELEPKSTLRKFRMVQKEGKRDVTRDVDCYNLDVILSVGYRVSSKQGTAFRQWSTKVLSDHLVKGITVNAKRLEQRPAPELEYALSIIRQTMSTRALSAGETEGLLKVITEYAATWLTLKDFGEGTLETEKSGAQQRYKLTLGDARGAIASLKKNLQRRNEASPTFGDERPEELSRVLDAVFEGEAAVEQRAAHLLYSLIKEHPLEDGNKRIAAFLFIVYLTKNNALTNRAGERKFSDTALTALTLLIAESDVKQKEMMLQLVRHFIGRK